MIGDNHLRPDERGATAVEWAIIAAVSIAVIGFVAVLIWNKFTG